MTNDYQDEFPDLPGILAEVASVAGKDAALALAHAKGGTEVFITGRPTPTHWLSRLLGEEAAIKVSSHFSYGSADMATKRNGVRLLIPKGPKSIIGIDGGPVAAAALRQGVHVRTIYRHRAAARKALLTHSRNKP